MRKYSFEKLTEVVEGLGKKFARIRFGYDVSEIEGTTVYENGEEIGPQKVIKISDVDLVRKMLGILDSEPNNHYRTEAAMACLNRENLFHVAHIFSADDAPSPFTDEKKAPIQTCKPTNLKTIQFSKTKASEPVILKFTLQDVYEYARVIVSINEQNGPQIWEILCGLSDEGKLTTILDEPLIIDDNGVLVMSELTPAGAALQKRITETVANVETLGDLGEKVQGDSSQGDDVGAPGGNRG